MKQSGMCLSLLLFGATCAHAQVTQQWVAEFGPGNGVDVANAIAVDAAGNV